MEFTNSNNSQFDYMSQPAPAYPGTLAGQLPPPPPSYEAAPTPSGSYHDLSALDTPPSYGDHTGYGTPSYPGTPMKQNSGASLDVTKFRTKLCRHYVAGNACPFEERCAFAHSHEEQAAARAAQPLPPPPPAYDFATTQSQSGSSSDVDAAEARQAHRPDTPPAYPTKYRHDPYNMHTAMVYAQ